MRELNILNEELSLLNILNDDNSFIAKSGGPDNTDLNMTTNSHLDINVREFNIYEFLSVVKKIQSGEILINIKSTGIVVRTFVKLLEQINQNLIEICS